MSRRALVESVGGAAFLSLLPVAHVGAEEVDVKDGFTAQGFKLPEFDESGNLISKEKAEIVYNEVDLGEGLSYKVPILWKKATASWGWDDPVNGPQIKSVTLLTAPAPNGVTDIQGLGKIEKLNLKKLPVPKELIYADNIALVNTTRGNVRYYEWDFALSPKECADDKQIVRGICFPDEVCLLSACINNGKLYVFDVRATEPQWKQGSKAIKALRKSFKLTV